MKTKGFNSNQLKIIALTAMTIDHMASVIWPNNPTDWWIILLYIIGRIAAPIFWFMAHNVSFPLSVFAYGLVPDYHITA